MLLPFGSDIVNISLPLCCTPTFISQPFRKAEPASRKLGVGSLLNLKDGPPTLKLRRTDFAFCYQTFYYYQVNPLERLAWPPTFTTSAPKPRRLVRHSLGDGGSFTRRLVEREGFEPSMPFSRHTRFPIVLFQPLRHLSNNKSL